MNLDKKSDSADGNGMVGGVTMPFLIFKELPYRVWNLTMCMCDFAQSAQNRLSPDFTPDQKK